MNRFPRSTFKVIKRNGSHEDVSFDKIKKRLDILADQEPPLQRVDTVTLSKKVIERIYPNVKTTELDTLSASLSETMSTSDPEYGVLASRIIISNHQKGTLASFRDTLTLLYRNTDSNGDPAPLISDSLWNLVEEYSDLIESRIDYSRDYLIDYFGFKTLERAYLLKLHSNPIERIQHLWMRVSLGIHGSDLHSAFETYDLMSQKYFVHATPTLFNAGTPRPQLASCFPAGTKVFTTNRGAINIETVNIGDSVVTHLGRVKPVQQLYKNSLNDRRVFNIKCYMTPEFNVTDNHKLWSITSEQLKWGEKPQWNSVECLRIGDYIAIPNYIGSVKEDTIDMLSFSNIPCVVKDQTYSFNTQIVIEDGIEVEYISRTTHYYFTSGGVRRHPQKESNIMKRYLKVDGDFAKFLGIWYGDGHIQASGRTVDNQWIYVNNGIGVASHVNNTELIKFVQDFSIKYFGLQACISKTSKKNCVSIIIHSGHLANVFEKLFGRGFAGKRITWEPMYDWDVSLIKQLLIGLISTDGCVSKDGNVTLQLSNYDLTLQIHHLCRRVGILVNHQKSDPTPTNSKTVPSYLLHFSKANPVIEDMKKYVYKTYTDGRLQFVKNDPYYIPQKIIDNTTFIRILKKNPVYDFNDQWVYTLGVEDDHSYSIAGIIAKNCNLLGTEDSIEGIYKTITDCAMISKYAGGIGIHISNIRAENALIRGTNGQSSGIGPMLKVYNETACYVNQAGKRNGSFAMYLEPWHADIFTFLNMRKNNGNEKDRARDLFYALWIPDLFMECVEKDLDWYLMCPDQSKGLERVHSHAFNELYQYYIDTGKYIRVVKARAIWDSVIELQCETGLPYILYKDSANRKSNQSNLGTIRSSNLCVVPETLVTTNLGDIPIINLVGKETTIWNGFEWSTVVPFRSNDYEPILRVTFRSGKVIDCTEYHRFPIMFSGNEKTWYEMVVEAKDLKPGMTLAYYSFPEEPMIFISDTVVSVKPMGYSSVYCLTEPIRNKVLFNGVCTLNCSEIIQYSDTKKYAVCNLASIGLPMFVKNGEIDHSELHRVTQIIVRNLNKTIDITFYPTPEMRHSNLSERPMGIGVQGLADLFIKLRLSFDSEEAAKVNREIFETIYHAAITESISLAMKDSPYSTFQESPASKGILQFDLWGTIPNKYSDWDILKEQVRKYGLRNSLLIALMPTASSGIILGFTECFEPIKSNIYKRKTLSGEYVVINKYLVNDLMELGLWSEEIKNKIIILNGSIQGIPEIPNDLKDLYKTVWEISQKVIIDLAADRSPFVCQSQSMNIYFEKVTKAKLTSMHFYGFRKGLKTGSYYIHSKPAADAQKVTIDSSIPTKNENEGLDVIEDLESSKESR